MNISNTLLVGFYVAFIIIFIYCYWGNTYYRNSATRIGMIASGKYYLEMISADPSRVGYDPRPASVVISGSSAIVKFNIFDTSSPAIPVGGAMRTYRLVDSADQCVAGSTISRKSTPECQGLLSEDMNKKCFAQTTTGLGCIWL
jgi:hypothetical protein